MDGTEIYKFKAKDSEFVATPLCLGNISKDWSVDNMKKTGFNGYVYDFSVDCDAIAVDDIKDIHKYLMKKNNIVWYVVSIGIGAYFVYYKYINRNKENVSIYDYVYRVTNY